jgi:hypothetical protein
LIAAVTGRSFWICRRKRRIPRKNSDKQSCVAANVMKHWDRPQAGGYIGGQN